MSDEIPGSLDDRRLAASLEAFPRHTVLVMGDVFVDEYLIGDASRISPEAPVPILHVKETQRTLGGAANTAANVASLGGKAVLIGMVGGDEGARILGKMVEAAGIDFEPVRDGRPTIRKTRIMGQRQQLIRLDHEETHYAGAETADRILELFRRRLPEADLVVLSDYAKGFLTEDVCQSVIREAKALGRPVVIDPRPQHGSFYRGCDYLTPNWKECQGLLGQPEGEISPDRIGQAGEALRARIASNVILTLGPKGMAFFAQDGSSFVVPTVAREVFDVSGAGDTVVAAFSLAKASGCEDREAVILANRAAGTVVGKLGTATVTREELLAADLGRSRLLTQRELAPLSRHLRISGKRIVTLTGTFDTLDSGHFRVIAETRRRGDVLLVGIESGAWVHPRGMPSRPRVSQNQRAEMLLALRDVDFVHIMTEDTPDQFLAEVSPDVHVCGFAGTEDRFEAPAAPAGFGAMDGQHR